MKVNSPEDAEIIIQKIGSDIGIHRNPRKGTLKAPDKILEDFEFGEKILIDEVFPDEFSLENTHRRIDSNMKDLLEYRKPILSIGGDHSISFPVISALKRKNPEMQLVWLDSHLDLKEKVGNHISHDVVVRELLNRGFSKDEIWIVGVTRVDEDEQGYLDQHNLQIFRHDELEEFLREFDPGEQPKYLSVDIDVLEEERAPGTGYPDGKLWMDEVEKVIEAAEPDQADLVEVAPPFDKDGKTIEAAREILRKIETSLVNK